MDATTEARISVSYLPVLWVGILLVLAFEATLAGIGGSWFDPNNDMGHGPAVPLVAIWIVWTKRDRIARVKRAPSFWGLFIVLLGALQFIVSSAADWIFATRAAFLVSLVGCIVTLWGWRLVRELAYPLALLILMITPPTFLQQKLTFQLQLIASRMAEWALDALGYSVLRDGNILEMVGERLSVAEACSGIRSLYTLFFFSLTYNYFFVPGTLLRWLMIIGVIPLALIGNAIRIVATGVIAQYNKPLAHGVLHEAWGYITVVLAGAFLVFLHYSLVRASALLQQHRRDQAAA